MIKILHIEDDTHFIKAFKTEIEKDENWKVISIERGDTAIKFWNLADREEFDIIVCDHNLPGKKGTEIIKEIRKTSDIPIIACSSGFNKKLINAGANTCMGKKITTYPGCEYEERSYWYEIIKKLVDISGMCFICGKQEKLKEVDGPRGIKVNACESHPGVN